MKKKGFTLIELLAVIIILAIIALVSTPIILNVVDDAKKSASLSEARMIYSGINNYCEEAKYKEQLSGTKNICKDGVTIEEIKQMVNLGNAKISKVTYTNKVTELVVESNGQVIELQPDGTFTINGEVAGGDPVTPPETIISITLNPTSASLYSNSTPNTLTLTASIEPESMPNVPITWKSSNESVATVNDDGIVSAKGNGTTVITATVGDKSATCNVTVMSYSTGGGGGR